MSKEQLIFDFEVYPNWNHVTFLDQEGNFTQFYAPIDSEALRAFVKGKTLIGFNSNNYDNYILSAVLSGMKTNTIYRLSKDLIKSGKGAWVIGQHYGLDKSNGFDFIDLMPLVAGFSGLKVLGARMHHVKLQELPFDPHEHLDDYQQQVVAEYCKNDCLITEKLYHRLQEQLALRIQLGKAYKLDLRSLGDAGIAEKVLLKKLAVSAWELKQNIPRHKFINYEPPAFINPTSPEVKALLGTMKEVQFQIKDSGHPELPDSLKGKVIELGDKSYKIGLGGLHSIDCAGMFTADDENMIIDVDVTSYYPAIITQTGWYPPQTGPKFNAVYQSIVDQRVEAKNAGRKADSDSLKIIVNSTYGKTGNQYSALYAPNLTVGITLTGQLALLMLIEKFEANDLGVISANTDGVTVRIKRKNEGIFTQLCSDWESDTGFNLERVDYKLFAQRDVNCYIAVTTDGHVKAKGALAIHNDLTHNPSGDIIQKAVTEYLLHNQSIESTVMASDDIRDFIYVKKVTGGATKDGNYLGSIVRWYLSTDTATPIINAKGSKVSLSDNGVPLMDIPSLSVEDYPDLDVNYYIGEAKKVLSDITQPKSQGRNLEAGRLKVRGFSPAPMTHKGKTIFNDDFSSIETIGTQTGDRVGLIQYDGVIYRLTEPGWPGAYKSAEKKLEVSIKFGGVVDIGGQTEIADFPEELRDKLFTVLTKGQKEKVETSIA
jgi:hypothetical protein